MDNDKLITPVAASFPTGHTILPTNLPELPVPPNMLTGVAHPTGTHNVDPALFTHESKLPPIKLQDQKPRLAKMPTLIAAVAVMGAIAIATSVAFTPAPAPKPADPSAQQQNTTAQVIQLPEVIQEHPTTPPLPVPESPGGQGGPFPRHTTRSNLPATAGTGTGDEDAQARAQQRRARAQALQEESAKALSSPLYANLDDPFAGDQRLPPNTRSSATGDQSDPQQAAAAAKAAAAAATGPPDPNLQGRKNDFLSQTDSSDGYLKNHLVRPRSPYELKSGSVIPAVLVTGIDSDLPGTIIGHVRENVYDTVTGNYLLIPQGSRLIATYDSMVAYGQERVLVCWNRIIRPDGTSLSLDCMPGADLAGQAGFADTVDHHWWRVITGVALGSLLGAGIQVPQGNVAGYAPTVGQAMAANAAGAVNQAGQQITSRALNIQPTIKIRPGFRVNVLVTKDIVLEPIPSPFR
jgi:type IV secretory pathway VirB10-like protein